jgi:hypothetical protein
MTKLKAILVCFLIAALLVTLSHFTQHSKIGVLAAVSVAVILPGWTIAVMVVPGGMKGNPLTLELVTAAGGLIFWTLFSYAAVASRINRKASQIDISASAP